MRKFKLLKTYLALVLSSNLVWAAPNAPANLRVIPPECKGIVFTPTGASPTSAGGAASITVAMPNQTCQWTASRDGNLYPWLSIDSGASGSGNGSVGYTVQA